MNELEAFDSDLYDGGTCATCGLFRQRRRKTFVKANWDTESVTMLCRPSKRINHPETTA